MFNKLRRHLTLISTLSTGLIMLFMIIVALNFCESQLRTTLPIAFKSQVNTLTTYIQTSPFIDNGWLETFEKDNRLIIHIEDQGTPLFFKGTYRSNTDRSNLIELAKLKAHNTYGFDYDLNTYSFPSSTDAFFHLVGSNKNHYLVSATQILLSSGTLTLTILKDIQPEINQITHFRWLFGGLFILTLVALFLFSWIFSGLATKPIEINHHKQISFVSSASHELRSPLTLIQSSAEAILTMPISDECSSFAQLIESECARMSRLIKDLLFLAHSDSKKLEGHFKPCDIETLLISTAELLEPLVLKSNQTITVSPNETILPLIKLDEDKFIQLLTILVHNATTYAGPHTRITFSIHYDSPLLKIYISDNGIGISDTHKAQIFDRFYKADKSRTKKDHYGLGLSIAKEIVNLHNGTLTVEDTPGGGATFIITLTHTSKL